MEYKILNIHSITEEDIQRVKTHLPSRYQKSTHYFSKEDCLRSIGSSLLLLEFFPSIKDEDIVYTEQGKPYIKNSPEFNLSHSGDYVAIVVDKNPVGIDLQVIDEKNVKYGHKIFKENELKFFLKNPKLNFHILWTQKEAVSKLFGLGLNLNFSKFDVTPFNENKSISLKNKLIYCKTEIKDDYVLSIAYFNEIKS